jgi:hypothetical protein
MSESPVREGEMYLLSGGGRSTIVLTGRFEVANDSW